MLSIAMPSNGCKAGSPRPWPETHPPPVPRGRPPLGGDRDLGPVVIHAIFFLRQVPHGTAAVPPTRAVSAD